MTAKTMRSFAGGLIVAASVCGAVYFSSPSEATTTTTPTTQTEEKPSESEMKSLLTSKGYVIKTEEEWNKQLAAVKDASVQTKEAPKEKIIYRTVLSVSSGMTSIDVGKALQRARIIKSGAQFSKEVEKRGVENNLRPGTYVVQSGMTIEKIISTVFKK